MAAAVFHDLLLLDKLLFLFPFEKVKVYVTSFTFFSTIVVGPCHGCHRHCRLLEMNERKMKERRSHHHCHPQRKQQLLLLLHIWVVNVYRT